MPEPNFTSRTVWTGDNLDVLRGINSGSVDLIYLDPPFNSNRTYSAPIGSKAAGAAFKDTWTLDDVDQAWHGEIADRSPALYAVIEAAGLAHGKGMKSYLIMMAVRLLELRRVLAETGSIYLHCDPTASHYLKVLMDVVFGATQFRNDITWKRTYSHGGARRWGPIHDTILFYTVSDTYLWNRIHQAYDPAYIEKYYRLSDNRGRYRLVILTGTGVRDGESGMPWRDIDPTDSGRHWAVPVTALEGVAGARDTSTMSVQEKLDVLDEAGLIYWPPRGRVPSQKRYLHESPGVRLQDIVTDIGPVTRGQERLGYPTQKPLALLERIIKASSNPGDMVLDPFCGCATTLVAAESLGREWAGIDLSPMAVKLVDQRLRDQHGVFGQIIARTDVPARTDVETLPDYRTHRHTLYGVQEGVCAGCRVHFPFRNLTVDHVVPRAKGGQDNPENLQLLCGACNSKKGTGTQAELVAKLKRDGLR